VQILLQHEEKNCKCRPQRNSFLFYVYIFAFKCTFLFYIYLYKFPCDIVYAVLPLVKNIVQEKGRRTCSCWWKKYKHYMVQICICNLLIASYKP
jgi:hypothetical protein